ncbi:glutamate--cysteine ligase [Ectothiorhodospiraceae bacterium 2226]|nr:glutamate--cysteine ligase [Ectothiorhodospiraceae bacterium 2226]
MSVEHLQAVPHLTTATSGPLQQLESHLLDHQAHIETWFRRQWRATPAPFYASVDLRNAGFKLAPVDTNLFPAGFNNLNPAFMPLCVLAVQSVVERICPTAARLLLIPENHTRNQFYFESLATLRDIILKAGFEVRIGSLLPPEQAPGELELPSGRRLNIEPLEREGNRLRVGDYQPCAIILNNDLSGGRPPLLEGIEQPIMPPPELGWFKRLKSEHFAHYRAAAQELAQLIDIDPWLIEPLFRNCGKINFTKREGEDCLARNVDALLTAIRAKYAEYDIPHEPFVVAKADAGTYGMAIMTVHSVDDIRELNRKQRTRMAATKEGQTVRNVILQEGVYTFETWGEAQSATEPVVYMIDHFVVGGFYRVHTQRGHNENLNAPGMHFEPLAFAQPCNTPDASKAPDAVPNRFYAYGVIARLALLAAAREIAEHDRSET